MTAPAAATRSTLALPGRAFPLGATARDGGTNFAVASAADSMPDLTAPDRPFRRGLRVKGVTLTQACSR